MKPCPIKILQQKPSQRQSYSGENDDLNSLNNRLQTLSLQDQPKKKIKMQQWSGQSESSQSVQDSSSVIAPGIRTYNITMESMAKAIVKKTVMRQINHKQPITTTLYKCKLESLRAYNYTFAIYLVNIIIMQFPFTMVQLVPLEDINGDQENYQVVYRFDFYDPRQKSQLVSEIVQNSLETPFQKLLRSQYKDFNIDQFISQYKYEKQKNPKCKTSLLDMFKNSFKNSIANINIKEGKFQIKLQDKDTQFQELISIFQTNLALNMFIRSYRLEYDLEVNAKDFRSYMKALLKKYPNAIYE